MTHLYDENYEKYLYSGAQGAVMRAAHRMLERGIAPERNRNILELGGGAMPHLRWVDRGSIGRYTISDTRETLEKLRHSPLHREYEDLITYHVFEDDPDFSKLLAEHGPFSRIIASHVWEHIPDPEGALKRWVELLEAEDVLSIGLPCDPGLAWRLGQRLSARKFMKLYGGTFADYDLHMAHEHVNSAQRLLKIFRYYFPRAQERFFPFPLPLVEINLLINLTAHKKDFRAT